MPAPKKTYGSALVYVKEAADILDVSNATVRRLCDAGRLVWSRDPRNKYRQITRESVVRLIATDAASTVATCEQIVREALEAIEEDLDPAECRRLLNIARGRCAILKANGAPLKVIESIQNNITSIYALTHKAGD